MKTLKQILSKEAFYYFQGNIRAKWYFSKYWKFLIRPHIREQIQLRLLVIDSICKTTGICKLCGCNTPALQMCDKACNKPCYPPMLNKAQWMTFTGCINIHRQTDVAVAFLYRKLAKSEKFINATQDTVEDYKKRYKVLLDLQRYVKLD